jgi:hypothetical protein
MGTFWAGGHGIVNGATGMWTPSAPRHLPLRHPLSPGLPSHSGSPAPRLPGSPAPRLSASPRPGSGRVRPGPPPYAFGTGPIELPAHCGAFSVSAAKRSRTESGNGAARPAF